MTALTIAAPVAINMIQGAREKGFNTNALLEKCGISPFELYEAGARVTFEQLSKLSVQLSRLLNDENYGLTSTPQRQGTYKLMGFSAIHAETIEQAARIFAEFNNLLLNDFVHEVVVDQKQACYRVTRRPGASIKNNFAIEHFLTVIHRTFCWMANTRLPLQEVQLDYREPDYSEEYSYMFFGTPVIFNTPGNALVMPRESFKLQNIRTFAHLKPFLKHAPLSLLSQTLQADYFSSQLNRWIERALLSDHRLPSLKQTAAYFEVHPQTVKNKLRVAGTNYQTLCMECRKEMALQLLADRQLSIEAIAYQLGYSEPSAFIRAFRQWLGTTPLAYRKRQLLS